MEVEEHVLRTIAQVPDHELRPLAAQLLQRAILTDGISCMNAWYPIIAKHWCEPRPHFNWPPPPPNHPLIDRRNEGR